ncbi:MAG: HlyD family efflux transporter periplasmic adaptor subunit, partial [Bacillota bacterium]|nr:HlyD family efflux transporter periplasmic adaptor subunit [Bacillota bacterium]
MKKFLSMVVVLAILMGVWWVYGKVSVVETRFTAVSGEFEDSFNAKGIVIRNEYPMVSAIKGGTLQSNVQNGTRVTKYTNVAYVYAGSANKEVVEELAEVNRHISEINNINDSTLLNLTDVNEINGKITSLSEQIAKTAVSGKNSEIDGLKNEINLLISRKRYVEGENTGESSDLTKLNSHKASLENQLGGSRVSLGAQISGLYYDFVDGYEGLKTAQTGSLTVGIINKVMKGDSIGTETKNAVCKMVDNTGWVISLIVDKGDIKGLSEGSPIKLRFNGSSEDCVNAKVSSYVYDGRKVIMNIAGTAYADNIYSERACTVDVIKNTYRGLKIPSAAIRDGGQAGSVVDVRTAGGII